MKQDYYEAKAFRYYQESQEFLSLVLPFWVVNQISKVLIYGEEPYGYQRQLNVNHYNKIKKEVLARKTILPTSIILSVDSDSIIREKEDCINLRLNLYEKLFRVVDGQHRIKGLEEATKVDNALKDFMFNVIVLITDPENRVVEVEVFKDINSKGKKIKTDLTLLARYNYELLGKTNIEDLSNHVAVKTAYYLNENKESIWYKAIQFDLDNSLGIIGVNAFIKSNINIVKRYLEERESLLKTNSKEELIEVTDRLGRELSIFLNDAWKHVKEKWENCFEDELIKDLDEYVKICFNDKFYLQRTIGANAINMILYETIFETSGDFTEEMIQDFARKIKNSKITSANWQLGATFTGLTSQAGFKKAKNLVLNL